MLDPRTAVHVHDQLRATGPLVQVITNYVSMDIAANLLKICIGLGIDSPAVHGMFMSNDDDMGEEAPCRRHWT